jgi:predicted lipoprotein with Yx(FWY)xxD motif
MFGVVTVAVVAFVMMILILSVGGAVTALAADRAAGAKVGTAHSGIGRIITDGRGRTLYLFEKDKRGRSACSGSCAVEWPPLVTHGKPVALAGVRKSLLGVIRRSNGSMQVSYAGHPVYRFIGDSRRGQTSGEGLDDFGGGWDALSPAGKKIEGGDS